MLLTISLLLQFSCVRWQNCCWDYVVHVRACCEILRWTVCSILPEIHGKPVYGLEFVH